MTDPVDRVNGARGVDRDTTRGEIFKRGKPRRRGGVEKNDSVDISEEARERSSGEEERGTS